MPTDDKMKRPSVSDPNPTSNVPDAVRQTLPTTEDRPQEHQRYHYRHAAEDPGQQLKQSARDTAEGLSETTDQLGEVLEDVQDWVRDQTQVRPVAVTASAFALGYVLGGGIPRWMVRFAARVGLPMAAAGAFARYIATAGTDRPSEGLQ